MGEALVAINHLFFQCCLPYVESGVAQLLSVCCAFGSVQFSKALISLFHLDPVVVTKGGLA